MSRLVLSPLSTVRWHNGRIVIARSRSRERIVTTDSGVLELLHLLRRPTSVEDAVRELSPRPAASTVRMLDELRAIGGLLVVESEGVATVIDREQFEARLEAQRKPLDFLQYDDAGLTVTNCGACNLSRGCQACKAGRWLCVFPGEQCNANCEFCALSPQREVGAEQSRRWLDQILERISRHAEELSGLSISGGELFLNYDPAREIIAHVKRNHPAIYLWAYTNGIDADRERMIHLRKEGLEEIRLNLAATRFSAGTMTAVRDAVGIFPWVTIEVPSCEDTYRSLVTDGKLAVLADMGVKQLNLAEIFMTAGDSNAFRSFYREPFEVYDVDGHFLSPASSRLYTYQIFDHAHRQAIDIRINDCSNDAKKRQAIAAEYTGLSRVFPTRVVRAATWRDPGIEELEGDR